MQPPSSALFGPSLVPIMRKVGASAAAPCCPLRLTLPASSQLCVSLLPGPNQMQILTRTWITPMGQNQHAEEGATRGPGAPADSLQVSWELPSVEEGDDEQGWKWGLAPREGEENGFPRPGGQGAGTWTLPHHSFFCVSWASSGS